MTRLFVVLLNQRGTKILAADEIQAKLDDIADEWLRTGVGQYFLRFRGNSSELYDVIRPIIQNEDYLFISELTEGTTKGWAGPIAVEWFDKHG